MKQIVYIEVETLDPTFNLALEEYVFEHMPRENEYFLTWRNDNAIIIGRHQNTAAEINAEYVEANGISVVRRLSGGGAVYHDLGNLNFTFIVDAEPGQKVDLRRFCQPIADTLCELGANAMVDGRNDILIDGMKISGNAQYVRQGRVMHHGTILFDSDMTVLSQALKPDPTKMSAKGVKSVRSRVTTVRPCLREDMTIHQFRAALTESLFEGEGIVRYELTDADVAAIVKIQQERYAKYEWNYGFANAGAVIHKRRFDGCGLVEAHITLENGIIKALHFHGDYFSTLSPEELAQRFVGISMTEHATAKVLNDCLASDHITGLSNEDLIDLLVKG